MGDGKRGGASGVLLACSFNQPLWRYGRRAWDGGMVAEEGQSSPAVCTLLLTFPLITNRLCVYILHFLHSSVSP